MWAKQLTRRTGQTPEGLRGVTHFLFSMALPGSPAPHNFDFHPQNFHPLLTSSSFLSLLTRSIQIMMECHLLPSHRLQQPHGSPQRAQRPLSRRLCAIPAHTPAATQAVYVFSTPGCQFCKRAKQTLAEQGVAYRDVDVSSSSELRQALQQATGQRTVPQVCVR